MSIDDPKNNWQANTSLDILKLRASVFQSIREFFRQRDVLEVDTPVLSSSTNTDPHIQSFSTQYISVSGTAADGKKYLSTSPEFHMKRLLSSGSGSIYQLGHVFRQSELGSQHNPEFTMLEWYRVGYDYFELMEEVADLVSVLFKKSIEVENLSYQKAFIRYLDVDPFNVSEEELQTHAEENGLSTMEAGVYDKDYYLDFLMSHLIQPKLGNDKLTFVHEYPASQCALAKISPDDDRFAERFELFYRGVELANGYHELIDAAEQQRRFEQQNQARVKHGGEPVEFDQYLVQALEAGMPACSGVALGVDRIIQLRQGAKSLQDILAFPFNRA